MLSINFKFLLILILIVFAGLSTSVFSKPIACTGISKKCSKDKTYDKIIEGKTYSCYDCKQTMCSSNGSTHIGTKTNSVCKEKSTTKRFINSSKNYHFNGGSNQISNKAKPPSSKKPKMGKKTQFATKIVGGTGANGYTCTNSTADRDLGQGTKSCSCTGGRNSLDCQLMLSEEECAAGVKKEHLVCTDEQCLCTKRRDSPTNQFKKKNKLKIRDLVKP